MTGLLDRDCFPKDVNLFQQNRFSDDYNLLLELKFPIIKAQVSKQQSSVLFFCVLSDVEKFILI